MVRLAIATIFLMAVAVVVTNAEASAATKSKYAYATIHYEGTPKDAGNVHTPARSADHRPLR